VVRGGFDGEKRIFILEIFTNEKIVCNINQKEYLARKIIENNLEDIFWIFCNFWKNYQNGEYEKILKMIIKQTSRASSH
jgi:hypothetical protein